jgi:recombination protein RecT
MSPSTAPAKPRPQAVVVDLLNRYKPVVTKLLARTDISTETFVAQIANAMRVTPKLWDCDPETVLGAALRCAQLGLPPNDGNNLAWILPYGRTATFQLGYGGVMELARRAMPGTIFDGAPVYPNDTFEHEMGSGKFRHVPAHARRPPRDRGGPARAWWVRIEYPDGKQRTHSLTREDVEYHRSFSKQRDGDAWKRSYDAMALKSVVLDMRRWLPPMPQLVVAQGADGSVVDVRDLDPEQPELPAPEPAPLDDDEAWVAEAKDDPT